MTKPPNCCGDPNNALSQPAEAEVLKHTVKKRKYRKGAKKPPQRHHHTALEVTLHLITGLLVTIVVLVLFFPEVSFAMNVNAALAVSAIKLVVNYLIRRVFTRL